MEQRICAGYVITQSIQVKDTLNVIDVQRYDAAVHKFEEAVKQITEAVICPRPMDR